MYNQRSDDGTLKLRAEFASSKAEIYDASDDGSQDVETSLDMSLDDVDILRTIADKDIVHIKRALDTRRGRFNYRINFQTEQSNR